jgi:hypothetical protein
VAGRRKTLADCVDPYPLPPAREYHPRYKQPNAFK